MLPALVRRGWGWIVESSACAFRRCFCNDFFWTLDVKRWTDETGMRKGEREACKVSERAEETWMKIARV